MSEDKVVNLALSDVDALDEAELDMLIAGKPSGWKWRFAGPGHELGLAQSKRVAEEQLHKNKMQEQQRLNMKKIKVELQTPDELKEDNVNFVLERLLGWNTVSIDGTSYPYDRETARKFLLDPRKNTLLQQAVEFILDDNSFMKRSTKN